MPCSFPPHSTTTKKRPPDVKSQVQEFRYMYLLLLHVPSSRRITALRRSHACTRLTLHQPYRHLLISTPLSAFPSQLPQNETERGQAGLWLRHRQHHMQKRHKPKRFCQELALIGRSEKLADVVAHTWLFTAAASLGHVLHMQGTNRIVSQ